jgi:ATP-dependent helicase IRC3
VKMIKINLTNTRCKLLGDIKEGNKLRDALKFRHPNAWFLRSHMPKGWDGFIYDITENWTTKNGLIPKIVNKCKELRIDWEIIDLRETPEFQGVPNLLGKKFVLRDYQKEAIKSITNNKLPDGTPFQIGVINAATNAGKSIIASGLHKSYKGAKTLVLLNQSDLFNQGLKEYPEYLPDEDVGFIQGKKYNHWGNFTVAMVQTVSQNLKSFRYKLEEIDIVIVDECDLADNKTYKSVLNYLYNTSVRVGLSGSVYLSKLKKHELKNNNIRSFFGEELFKISKMEMVEKGYSSELVIKINHGIGGAEYDGDYDLEYRNNIIYNRARNEKIIERLWFNINRGRIPILVICKFHDHVDEVFKYVANEFGDNFAIDFVHHKTKRRKEIIEAFRNGHLDILVSSMIIKRGQNLPLTRCLINTAGGDSEENVLQIMGRGERKHESKKKTYLEDFADSGKYLRRHSKHRIAYYKKQGFKVINLF